MAWNKIAIGAAWRFCAAVAVSMVACLPMQPARADMVYFTTGTGVDQVTQGGTPSVFVQETGDGATGNHLNDPFGITIDNGGNLFVSSQLNGYIVKIAPDATTSVFDNTDTTSWLYAGLAVDSGGNIYAAEIQLGNVVKITPGGTSTTIATGLNRPEITAVDASDNVYSDNDDDSVTKITAGSKGVGSH